MNVGFWDWFTCERVYVLHFDGEIRRELTKEIDAVRVVSSYGLFGTWKAVCSDGTFYDKHSYMKRWSFKLNELVHKS